MRQAVRPGFLAALAGALLTLALVILLRGNTQVMDMLDRGSGGPGAPIVQTTPPPPLFPPIVLETATPTPVARFP
ncbi:MAG TPA: hypothetical protein VFW71_06760 [Actinomycetota bacterium]|nr:hypothetical protein [Actinomycetota bacterium]